MILQKTIVDVEVFYMFDKTSESWRRACPVLKNSRDATKLSRNRSKTICTVTKKFGFIYQKKALADQTRGAIPLKQGTFQRGPQCMQKVGCLIRVKSRDYIDSIAPKKR